MVSTTVENYFKERGVNCQVTTYDNGDNVNCSTMIYVTGYDYAFEYCTDTLLVVIDANDDGHVHTAHHYDDNSFDYLYTIPGFKFEDVKAVIDILGSHGKSAHITFY